MGLEDGAQRGGDLYDLPGMADRYLAHRHSGPSSPNLVMEEPALLARLGDVQGQRILDLGCGDGTFGRWAMTTGAAAYLGVDASAEMALRARRTLEGTGAEVAHQDIADVEADRAGFDLIVSRMTLHTCPASNR